MSNTTKRINTKSGLAIGALSVALGLGQLSQTVVAQESQSMNGSAANNLSETLSARQQAIVPVAALAAAGDITGLSAALQQGLDAGLTISDERPLLPSDLYPWFSGHYGGSRMHPSWCVVAIRPIRALAPRASHGQLNADSSHCIL